MPRFLYMEGMMPSSSSWMEYAQFDSCYAEWLERLDDLCHHMLNIRFLDLIEHSDFDPRDDYYTDQIRPDAYLQDKIIPHLQYDSGAEFVFEMMAENIIWGHDVRDHRDQRIGIPDFT